jgi:hypothetical protein
MCHEIAQLLRICQLFPPCCFSHYEDAVHATATAVPCEKLLENKLGHSDAKGIPEGIWYSQSSQEEHNTVVGTQVGNNWIS